MKKGIYYVDSNGEIQPIKKWVLAGGNAINGSEAGMASSVYCPIPKNIMPTKAEQIANEIRNLEIVTEMFIKESEKEIERIKRKGSQKEKLSYLKTKMKNKEPIRKQVNKIINERIGYNHEFEHRKY